MRVIAVLAMFYHQCTQVDGCLEISLACITFNSHILSEQVEIRYWVNGRVCCLTLVARQAKIGHAFFHGPGSAKKSLIPGECTYNLSLWTSRTKETSCHMTPGQKDCKMMAATAFFPQQLQSFFSQLKRKTMPKSSIKCDNGERGGGRRDTERGATKGKREREGGGGGGEPQLTLGAAQGSSPSRLSSTQDSTFSWWLKFFYTMSCI